MSKPAEMTTVGSPVKKQIPISNEENRIPTQWLGAGDQKEIAHPEEPIVISIKKVDLKNGKSFVTVDVRKPHSAALELLDPGKLYFGNKFLDEVSPFERVRWTDDDVLKFVSSRKTQKEFGYSFKGEEKDYQVVRDRDGNIRVVKKEKKKGQAKAKSKLRLDSVNPSAAILRTSLEAKSELRSPLTPTLSPGERGEKGKDGRAEFSLSLRERARVRVTRTQQSLSTYFLMAGILGFANGCAVLKPEPPSLSDASELSNPDSAKTQSIVLNGEMKVTLFENARVTIEYDGKIYPSNQNGDVIFWELEKFRPNFVPNGDLESLEITGIKPDSAGRTPLKEIVRFERSVGDGSLRVKELLTYNENNELRWIEKPNYEARTISVKGQDDFARGEAWLYVFNERIAFKRNMQLTPGFIVWDKLESHILQIEYLNGPINSITAFESGENYGYFQQGPEIDLANIDWKTVSDRSLVGIRKFLKDDRLIMTPSQIYKDAKVTIELMLIQLRKMDFRATFGDGSKKEISVSSSNDPNKPISLEIPFPDGNKLFNVTIDDLGRVTAEPAAKSELRLDSVNPSTAR